MTPACSSWRATKVTVVLRTPSIYAPFPSAVAPPIIAILRKWPGNRFATDRIDKLAAKEAESPKELLSESIVIAATGGTPAQARLTLHLVGYQLKGGIWPPLGIDELSKSADT